MPRDFKLPDLGEGLTEAEIVKVLVAEGDQVQEDQPVFLVEAEDRHRAEATRSVFEFFRNRSYRGFFLKDIDVIAVEQFDPTRLQDADALRPDGGRKDGQFYVNNFFFFPRHLDGESILSS